MKIRLMIQSTNAKKSFKMKNLKLQKEKNLLIALLHPIKFLIIEKIILLLFKINFFFYYC